MTLEEVKRGIWRNTASNYLCLALRVVLGVVIFRLLYQELSREEFGFWALLWSVYGFGVLLDFGFGFTAQKRVAELSVSQDWEKLSQVLSTIFFCYVAVGAAIALAGSLASGVLIDLFSVSAQNRQRFHEILILFFIGLGLAFPMGLFPEVLRGQQRIALGNVLFSIGMIANFVLAILAIRFGWGLKALVLIALVCTFIPDLLCGAFALARLRAVRIWPRHFSKGMVRETMGFSLFAYVAAVSNLAMGKTDQLIISSALSVSAVAVYQAGAKVAEMFAAGSQQLPDTFSPVAAHLNAKGDRGLVRQLLLKGSRFTAMLATPLYLICAIQMENLLRLLTGESLATTFWVGQVLLLWSYTTVITQSVSKRVYMMCGHERRVMLLGVGEALLNLVLSTSLVLYFRNVLCVAMGSLISSFIFGWLILWPWAAREAQLSGLQLARLVLAPTWLACLPLLAFVLLEPVLPLLSHADSFTSLLLGSALAAAVAALGLWRLALTAVERERLSELFLRLLQRRNPA